MTIYEVLERLIIGPPLKAEDEQAAVEVIHQLRDMNALGTTTASVDLPGHECRSGSLWGPPSCSICGKAL